MGLHLRPPGAAAALAIAAAATAGCGSGPDPRPPANPAPRPAGAEQTPRPQATVTPHRPGPMCRSRAAGPRLFLAGDGELWTVDVPTESVRRHRMPQLIGGDPPHRIVRRGDRFVLWGAGTLTTGRCLGRPRTLEREAAFFLPSAHPGRIWLAYPDPRAAPTEARFAAVREVTARGRVTVPDARPPPGWPERAARAGLLISQRRPRHLVWDPRTDTVVNALPAARLGDLGPIHGNTLASCTGRCTTLRLTNVHTGAQRRHRAPRGLVFEPAHGAFSSTGSELALPVRPAGRARGSRRLALVKLDHLATKLIPGSRVPEGYTLVDWSPDDGHVFLTGGHGPDRSAIVAYDRARARVQRLDVRTGAFYGMAAG